MLFLIVVFVLSMAETRAQTPPSFLSQPDNVSVGDEGSITINVRVATSTVNVKTDFGSGFVIDVPSPAPVSWKLKLPNRMLSPSGVATGQINNQITASLSFGPISIADAGAFQVVATNSYGDTLSSQRTLSVTPTPTRISSLTPSQTILLGQPVTFTVVGAGTGPLSYQWKKNAANVPGATNTTLTFAAVTTTDAGSYSVTVSNQTSSFTSAESALTVSTAAPPVISTQPTGATAIAGSSVTLNVGATGTATLSYQWRKDGAPVAAATGPSLVLNVVQNTDAGNYSVVVTNSAGNVTSATASLIVITPPVISAQPTNSTALAGGSVSFRVAAIGTAPFSYQWLRNGSVIAGATASTLTFDSVLATDAASYSVAVGNSAGSTLSVSATLNVQSNARISNLSVLASLTGAGDSFTLGYVVGGSGTFGAKPLVIRAAGPSLGALGVPGTLEDPKLETFAASTKNGENDNWGGSAQLTAALAAVGAFPYAGPSSRDAAVSTNSNTRDNSVVISSANNGTGAVIAEIYDATPGANFAVTTPRLLNVSVRKFVGTGLTVGFTIGGTGIKAILIRAIGPGLAVFGVPSTVVDPQLTLFNGASAKIGENNDWGGTFALNAAFSGVGAFALPSTSKDAALLVSLSPGGYSVQVSGVANTTGVALVEVYEVP